MTTAGRHQGRADQGQCGECGKPLEYYRCSTCNGSGQRRSLFLLSRPCDVCNGSGQVLRCPDASAHVQARQAQIMQSIRSIQAKRSPASASAGLFTRESMPPGSSLCQNCKGSGKVSGRKQVPHPQKYMRAIPGYKTIWIDALITCPVCNGRGWLTAQGRRR